MGSVLNWELLRKCKHTRLDFRCDASFGGSSVRDLCACTQEAHVHNIADATCADIDSIEADPARQVLSARLLGVKTRGHAHTSRRNVAKWSQQHPT